MQSIRRAVLKAAWSSSRAIAAPRQVASVVVRASRVNAQPATALPLSRYFSQTASVFTEAEDSTPFQSNSAASDLDRASQEGRAVYIANMAYDATTEHLVEAFGKYGEVLSATVAKDGRGLSRGFGFIAFAEKESAERAIAEADNSYWHGRRIAVQPRQQRTRVREPLREQPPSAPSSSVYVGNIPYETTDSELNKMFRNLENVVDVRVAVDRNTGWPRGFAHADFMDVESATKAVEFLRSQVLSGRKLRVDYSQPRTLNRRQPEQEGSSREDASRN